MKTMNAGKIGIGAALLTALVALAAAPTASADAVVECSDSIGPAPPTFGVPEYAGCLQDTCDQPVDADNAQAKAECLLLP